MACYHPLKAYRSLSYKTENGKAKIAFNRLEISDKPYEDLELPCGQCIGCRIARSKEWAVRCVHEASMWTDNCFITLTFDDEHADKLGTLVKSDFQKFMKRFRIKFRGNESTFNSAGKLHYPIRYFHCGEYGDELSRPHHHACIFNFDFLDKKVWSIRDDIRLYRSEELEKLWPYGYCTIGDVTYESAAYCARYITKKINGDRAEEHYTRNKFVDKKTGEVLEHGEFLNENHVVEKVPCLPEYITMSRRPGIGSKWYEKYGESDVRTKDYVTLNGKKFKTPKFYDRVFETMDAKRLERIKNERIRKGAVQAEHNTRERLAVRETIQLTRAKQLKRGYENGSQHV